MLHKNENNEQSQEHLDSNNEKFQSQCELVLKMLYSGKRLSAKILTQEFDMADGGRRLRDVIKARPDVVKKEWVKSPDGKTKYMEYYIDKFKAPTKSELQSWFESYQKEKGKEFLLKQAELFS